MGANPAFPFYCGDWLSSTKVKLMTLEQQGAYIRLLAHSWLENGLPNNDKDLAVLSGLGRKWKRLGNKVRSCFYLKANGKLYNKKQEKLRKKRLQWIRKSKEGGKKSGKVRREKSLQTNHPSNHPSNGGCQMVGDWFEPKPDSSSSSSSSLSSSKETTKKEKLRANALSVFDYYQEQIKPLRRFEAWQPKIEARLKKYSAFDLEVCIDHLRDSDWHREQGYDGLDQIVDSNRRVEKWLTRKTQKQTKDPIKESFDAEWKAGQNVSK